MFLLLKCYRHLSLFLSVNVLFFLHSIFFPGLLASLSQKRVCLQRRWRLTVKGTAVPIKWKFPTWLTIVSTRWYGVTIPNTFYHCTQRNKTRWWQPSIFRILFHPEFYCDFFVAGTTNLITHAECVYRSHVQILMWVPTDLTVLAIKFYLVKILFCMQWD